MRRLLGLLLCLSLSLGAPVRAQLGAELEPASFVRYRAATERETFAGVAPVEGITLRLFPDALSRSELRLTVRPERFDSGNLLRDTNARRTVFESGLYPEAAFTLEALTGPSRLAEGVVAEVELRGTLELHGVSRPLSVTAQLERQGDRLRARGAFSLKLSDFGMTRPSFLFWQVEDEVQVTFDLRLRLESSAFVPVRDLQLVVRGLALEVATSA